MPWEEFGFTNEFQDTMLACTVRYPDEFWSFGDIVRPQYFSTVEAAETAFALKDYIEEFGKYPNFSTLANWFVSKYDRTNQDKAAQLANYVFKLTELDCSDWEGVRKLMVKFAKERALFKALRDINLAQMDGKGDTVDPVRMVEEALSVGEDARRLGISVRDDYERVIRDATGKTYGVATGYNPFDNLWKNGWGPGWLIVLLAPPKSYKCEAPGTKVLMFDGSVKTVEQIKIGDKLMGDDSVARLVTACGKGYGPLYRVKQANGDSYTVTADHPLCVRRDPKTVPIGKRFRTRYHASEILEIAAEDYAKRPKWFQRTWKGYKAAVDFPTQPVPIDPYFLGIWLGDGAARSQTVYTGSKIVTNYLEDYAARLKLKAKVKMEPGCYKVTLCGLKGRPNPILDSLRALKILHESNQSSRTNPTKSIPTVYRINDREKRLNLLAGLLDSDGYYRKNNGFIFTNTNQKLAEDVCWLARSLGFKAYLRQAASACKALHYTGFCFRVYIQGKISQIPAKVRPGIDSPKASNLTNINVEPAGEGVYFGFTLDGNQRYLHSDFTVTHNTTLCLNLALNMAGAAVAQDVIYYACEIDEELAAMRTYYNLSGINSNGLFEQGTEKFIEATRQGIEARLTGNIWVKSFPSKGASILDIEQHAKFLCQHQRIQPKCIFVDFAETVRPTLVGKNVPDYRQQADIYTSARAMGSRLRCAVVMPDRCNRETVNKTVPNITSFQGAFQKGGEVDVGIGICFTKQERLQNHVRYFVFANRHGPQYVLYEGRIDPELMRMTVDRKVPYTPVEDEDEPPRRGHKSKERKKMAEEVLGQVCD
jgi:hypothetical protein